MPSILSLALVHACTNPERAQVEGPPAAVPPAEAPTAASPRPVSVAPATPAKVRVELSPVAGLLDLVVLAGALTSHAMEIPDDAAAQLERKAIVVRCDEEVTLEAVWRALEIALAVNGWALRIDEGTATPVPTPQDWHGGDRAVDLIVVEGVPADAVARALRSMDDEPVRIAVDPGGNTLIVGGPKARVAGVRQAVAALQANPELAAGGEVLCPYSVGSGLPPVPPAAKPAATTRVRLNFPQGASLVSLVDFYCNTSRFAVGVPDIGALERERFTLHAPMALSPSTALWVYEHVLAVRGWALRSGASMAMLTRTEPIVVAGGEARVELVALEHLGADEAAIALGRDGRAGTVRVDALSGAELLIIGGSAEAVARARGRIAALEAEAGGPDR